MRYTTLDPLQQHEQDERAGALVAAALSKHYGNNAPEALDANIRARGFARYEPHIKAAVDPLGIPSDAAPTPIHTAFVGAVDRESIIGRLDGAHLVPPGTWGRIQIGTVTARTVDQGGAKPVGTMTFDLALDVPVKIPATLVIGDTLAKALDATTQANIRRALVSATAAAVDRYLLGIWCPEGSPTTAIDATTADMTTVGALLAAISDGAPARPHLVGSFATLLPLAGALRDLRDLGVGVITTPAAGDRLIAVDGAGLLLSDGGADVMVARQADMVLDDGSGESTSTTVVSLFQRNLIALRAERYLAAHHRPDAVSWAAIAPSEG